MNLLIGGDAGIYPAGLYFCRPRFLYCFLFASVWIASSVATTDNHKKEGFGAGTGREKGEYFRVWFIAE